MLTYQDNIWDCHALVDASLKLRIHQIGSAQIIAEGRVSWMKHLPQMGLHKESPVVGAKVRCTYHLQSFQVSLFE